MPPLRLLKADVMIIEMRQKHNKGSTVLQSSFITRLDALNAVLTRRVSLLCSLLAVIICLLGFQWLKSQLGGLMLDELQGYDRDDVNTQMLLYGETGRSLHLRFTLLLDMVFPFAYGAFFGGLLVLAARGTFDRAILLPVLAVMLLDFTENIQLAFMLAQFPTVTDAKYALASATTMGKFWAIRFFLWWLGGLVWLEIVQSGARAPISRPAYRPPSVVMICFISLCPRKVMGNCAIMNKPVAGAIIKTRKLTQSSSLKARQAISLAKVAAREKTGPSAKTGCSKLFRASRIVPGRILSSWRGRAGDR